MMGWDWGHMATWGWGSMMFGGLGMLALWGLLIAFTVWAVRSLSGGDRRTSPPGGEQRTPLEILQARYARGEIGREEYDAVKRDLQAT